ncbi:MAG: CDGSH iron-sulfur domain-containing protein [Burkholderiaceae bacterium]
MNEVQLRREAADPLPVSPKLSPYYVELRPRQTVLWCSCGLSARQPYCDGSHRGTGFEPLRHTAGPEGEEVLLCACKRTCTPPHCDGTHNALVGVYGVDDPDSEANRRVVWSPAAADGRARVDGGCFVCSVDRQPFQQVGTLSWARVITADDGALHQSQFCLDFAPGESPVVAFGDCEVALMAVSEGGTVDIAGRRFDFEGPLGIHVRPGEAFRIHNRGTATMRVFASAGASLTEPLWPQRMDANFDDSAPLRLAPVEAAQRVSMAERYFQMLVDKRHGSQRLTQFIGEIPRSKALPHRHLYEESLIVLSGQGVMWTETLKAPVNAGDVIFLPRKQQHSLECTSESPMLVVGVIYPGDNPAINYYD